MGHRESTLTIAQLRPVTVRGKDGPLPDVAAVEMGELMARVWLLEPRRYFLFAR